MHFSSIGVSPWRFRCSLVGILLLIVGMTGTIPAVAQSPTPDRLLIGMGDSYTAGPGITPYEPSSVESHCNRSMDSYPFLAAEALAIAGKSVACGGAVTADFTSVGRKGEPAQASQIAEASYIAFTIGGNDVGGPKGVIQAATTRQSEVAFGRAVAALQATLVKTYKAVLAGAPRARVFVMGYPDIFPVDQQTFQRCLGSAAGGVRAADVHNNVNTLNQAIRKASAAAGVTFVSNSESFTGHDMCSSDPYATAPGGVVQAGPRRGGALHPNAVGHQVMAANLVAAIKGPTGTPAALTTAPLPTLALSGIMEPPPRPLLRDRQLHFASSQV